MQQRATALYTAFFLLIAVGSLGLIATAEEPTVEIEDPDYELSEGDEFEIDGQQYTLSSVSVEEGEESSASGEITWVEEDARQTETWDNGSSVALNNQSYVVQVPSGEDPGTFRLVEEIDRQAILEEDPNADNETVTRNDEEYVAVEEDGETRLVPPEEYFPEPESGEFQVGAQFELEDRTVEVTEITSDGVTVEWTEDVEGSVTAEHRGEVELGDQTYIAYFRSDGTLLLSQDFEEYNRQVAEIDRHHEQRSSLRTIAVLSGFTIVLLMGMAYMPSRY